MKKYFPHIIKKYVYPSVLCVTLGSDMTGSLVHRNNLRYKVRESAETHLYNNDILAGEIPARLRPDYESKLEDAQTILYNCTASRGNTYIDQSEIDRVIREKMKPFIDNMRSIIHKYELASKMHGFIRRFLWEKSVNPNKIPARFEGDFESRKHRVISKLNSMMYQDGRDYVRISEVEKAIRDEFAFFVTLLLDAHETHRPYSNQSSGLDNYLFGHATLDDIWDMDIEYEPSAPAMPASDQIGQYHIEGHVQEMAWDILRNHNIVPDNLPARVVSLYSDTLQTANRRLRNIMTVNGRDFVWRDEVASIVLEQLQPVIDTLLYKGEICAVCQDNYFSGDRVGTLDCGHFYHDECIKPWLSRNRSCPLCRGQGVYVAKIETVP